jgi:hypothetical protein
VRGTVGVVLSGPPMEARGYRGAAAYTAAFGGPVEPRRRIALCASPPPAPSPPPP